MNKHKDCLSNNSLNRILHNKYQPEGLVPTIKDPVDKKGRPLYQHTPAGNRGFTTARRIKYKEVS